MSETDYQPEIETENAESNPLDWMGDLPDSSLSPDDVLTGLLDFGLFAEKVPPCFTSEGLATFASKSMAGLFEITDGFVAQTPISPR